MKKYLPIFFICLLILVNPVYGGSEFVDETKRDIYIPSTARDTFRVYGTDFSEQVFDAVSLNSYRNYIIELTQNGSRPVGSPGDLGENNIAARNWIIDKLDEVSAGKIEVEVIGNYASVLGKLPGYLPVEAPAFMIGGHYDSVSAAPGANDDGTGVAAALEIARVMSAYNWPLDIYFGFWNAEEIGLLGSKEAAQIMRDRDVELLAYYNVDMLLVPNPAASEGAQVLMVYHGGHYQEGAYWADITRAMSQNFGLHMIQPVISIDFSGWDRSDHYPFCQQGYTALFAHESGFAWDTAYHTPMDRWDNQLYDYEVATEAVKAIGAAMAFTMARAYREPRSHDMSFNLVPSSSRDIAFAISTPTTINVTARWFGGGTSISLYDPNSQLLAQMVDDAPSPWEHSQIISQGVSSPGLYRLNIINHGGRTVGHEIIISYETDVNGNEVIDSEEFWFDQEYFSMDSDLDTINDAQEMIIGTLRDSNDTDMDTLPDPWELEHGLDPLDPYDALGDPDSDGVVNTVEYEYGCNPNFPDSDSDTMPDLWEIENGLSPTIDDANEDPDHDDVVNVMEFEEGTDPQFAEFRPQRLLLPASIIGTIAVAVIAIYRRRT